MAGLFGWGKDKKGKGPKTDDGQQETAAPQAQDGLAGDAERIETAAIAAEDGTALKPKTETDSAEGTAGPIGQSDEERKAEAEEATRRLVDALGGQDAPAGLPHAGARPVDTEEDDDAPPAITPEAVAAGAAGFGAATAQAPEGPGGGGEPPKFTPKKPGILSHIFRSAATMAVSIGTSIAFKAALAASVAAPAPWLVVGGTVIAVTTVGFMYRRTMDIIAHNSAHKDQKASLLRDFFRPSATGHTAKKYYDSAAASILISTVGGIIGFHFSDEIRDGLSSIAEKIGLGGGDAIPPVTSDAPPVPDAPPVATDAPPVVTDAPPVVMDAPPVVTDAPPVLEAPPTAGDIPPVLEASDAPEIEDTTEADDTAATTDEQDAPNVPRVVNEAPVLESTSEMDAPPVVDVAPAPLPALEQALAALPETPDAVLADTLARLGSDNPAIHDQAVKDLGYFFANGFHGVAENDVLANALFESVVHNAQAAHDLGYQLLHGIGAEVDLQRAFELLTYANDNGSTLAAEKLQYMARIGFSPA